MVDTVTTECDRKMYDRLLAETPVGMSFPWKGKHRLVHETECSRRYTTEVTTPVTVPEAA